MSNNSLNVYPSTMEMAPIRGGQDLVLALMIGARKRYKRYGTQNIYIDAGQVCAIGSIAREAGLTPKKFGDLRYHSIEHDMKLSLEEGGIETALAEAAQEAIQLLNASAGRLYPESVDDGWSGPLEWLNEGLEWSEAKKAVLASYDDAIKLRQETLA